MAKISNTPRVLNGGWPGHTRPAPAAQIHIVEIAEILATGLMRVLARKSSRISAGTGESSLHISAAESGHPIPENGGISDD